MLSAVPVGIDDTVQQATGTDSRPLGTKDVYRPFGVGGPVYNKTTGAKTTDNVGIPTGSGDYGPTSVKPEPSPTPVAATNESARVASGTATPNTPVPPATRPRPLQVLRESLHFDPPKPPAGTRSGDGPLRKIVGALTGQPKKSTTDAAAADAA
jgi:hypothetical protein